MSKAEKEAMDMLIYNTSQFKNAYDNTMKEVTQGIVTTKVSK